MDVYVWYACTGHACVHVIFVHVNIWERDKWKRTPKQNSRRMERNEERKIILYLLLWPVLVGGNLNENERKWRKWKEETRGNEEKREGKGKSITTLSFHFITSLSLCSSSSLLDPLCFKSQVKRMGRKKGKKKKEKNQTSKWCYLPLFWSLNS